VRICVNWTSRCQSSIVNVHSSHVTVIRVFPTCYYLWKHVLADRILLSAPLWFPIPYWSRTGRSVADRSPTKYRPDVLAIDAAQQAGGPPQHVDCARAEHAHCDAEPETHRRSSKSAEINDRDRFKRHARLAGVGNIRTLDVKHARSLHTAIASTLGPPPTACFHAVHRQANV